MVEVYESPVDWLAEQPGSARRAQLRTLQRRLRTGGLPEDSRQNHLGSARLQRHPQKPRALRSIRRTHLPPMGKRLAHQPDGAPRLVQRLVPHPRILVPHPRIWIPSLHRDREKNPLVNIPLPGHTSVAQSKRRYDISGCDFENISWAYANENCFENTHALITYNLASYYQSFEELGINQQP